MCRILCWNHFLLQNAVCYYVVLDMVFWCLGSLLGPFLGPNLAPKASQHGVQEPLLEPLFAYTCKPQFLTPLQWKSSVFVVQRGAWESQLRLKIEVWKQDFSKCVSKRIYGQQGPNISPTWAPSWPQVGPKMGPRWPKLTPRWPKLAQVSRSWHLLAHIGSKLIPK